MQYEKTLKINIMKNLVNLWPTLFNSIQMFLIRLRYTYLNVVTSTVYYA